MRIALFEPDIPQNTGTMLRLAACLGIEANLIEPAGFPVSDRAFRRAGMDYLDQVCLTRHPSWPDFERWRAARRLRLVLFTTKATVSYLDHRYDTRDILLFGRESAGVPDHVHAAADVRLRVPMRAGMRSLNVAMTCAMAVGEALRQRPEMSISAVRIDATAVDVAVTNERIIVTLADGRELSAPLAWFPRLCAATDEQRQYWRFIGRGHGIHWPEVDEDVSIAGLLRVV